MSEYSIKQFKNMLQAFFDEQRDEAKKFLAQYAIFLFIVTTLEICCGYYWLKLWGVGIFGVKAIFNIIFLLSSLYCYQRPAFYNQSGSIAAGFVCSAVNFFAIIGAIATYVIHMCPDCNTNPPVLEIFIAALCMISALIITETGKLTLMYHLILVYAGHLFTRFLSRPV